MTCTELVSLLKEAPKPDSSTCFTAQAFREWHQGTGQRPSILLSSPRFPNRLFHCEFSGLWVSWAMLVQVGVHLIFQRWGFMLPLACGDDGSVSRMVKQTGGRERISFCGEVPVQSNGCKWGRRSGSRSGWRHSGCVGLGEVGVRGRFLCRRSS